jgi:hypothetical protein
VADVEWRENRAGCLAALATPDAVDAMRHIGDLIRIRAEEIAPVDTGAYAFGVESGKGARDGGFKVEAGIRDGTASVRVINRVRSAPSKNWPNGYGYGLGLERGNSRMRGQRILGRALDALNLA